MGYLNDRVDTITEMDTSDLFCTMDHLPMLDEFFRTDTLAQDFGYLGEHRKNRTEVADYVPFEQTKFCQDALARFGHIDAVI